VEDQQFTFVRLFMYVSQMKQQIEEEEEEKKENLELKFINSI
jgi:hypothetical protein